MKVETEISEADVVNVKTGMDCSFTILGLPYRTFEGKLNRIDPAPSSYKSSAIYYNSDIIADNQDRTLRIDMTADVVINIADKKQVLTLPLTALRRVIDDSTAQIYVLKDNLVERKNIKVGLKDDQYIEIVGGLAKDEQVVIGDDVQTAEAQALEKDAKRRRGPF